jgi:hypothetical protein
MQLSILSLVSNKSSTIREKALYGSRRGFGGKFALFLDVLPLKPLVTDISQPKKVYTLHRVGRG